MQKLIHTILLAIILLSPLTGLEAKDSHDDEDRPFKHFKAKRFEDFPAPFVTKVELETLNTAILEINAKIDALEIQVGGLPPNLAEALAELQAEIDTNFDSIGGFLVQIELINTRLLELETSGSPLSDLVFSDVFTQNIDPRFGLKFDWAEFKSNATGDFSSIEIRNSNIGINSMPGGSAVCADQTVATAIVNELNTHVPSAGVVESFTCFETTLNQDVEWNVGFCNGEVELNARIISTNLSKVCECKEGATVRPLAGTIWGGVGTDFGGLGGTCSAPTQTLEVILRR